MKEQIELNTGNNDTKIHEIFISCVLVSLFPVFNYDETFCFIVTKNTMSIKNKLLLLHKFCLFFVNENQTRQQRTKLNEYSWSFRDKKIKYLCFSDKPSSEKVL